MGCGCNNKNKKLKLDNMRNMSLDDILKLYQDGYRLEDSITNPQPSNIRNMLPPDTKNTHRSGTRGIYRYSARNILRSGRRNSYRPSIRNMQPSGNIYSLQENNITIVNPPSAVPEQSVTFTVNYDLNVDWYGEWVKFRICYNGSEIGASWPTLLFGHSTGSINISATFPSGITGTIPVTAEVTINEFSWTCRDADVIASTTINIPAVTQGTNTIILLNLPSSVKPGWTIDLQVSYNVVASSLGELVKFRICANGNEIGSNTELLYGNAIGTVTIGATIPADVSGTVSIKAEVTRNELSWNCGDAGVVAVDGPTTVTVGTVNTISLMNTPSSLASGRVVDFTINYSLSVDSIIGEWVRFRICANGNEIGNNIELLFGNATGVIVVPSSIPPGATGTMSIVAEITIDEFSSTCGDPYVIAADGPVGIPVTQGNAISITNLPSSVSSGQNVDLAISYDLSVDSLGELVKFRICDNTGTEISSKISLLYEHAIGNVTIGTQIPPSATGTISLKAEVTINELSGTCGDSDVIAFMNPANVPIIGSVNSLIITNMPTVAASGQEIVFNLDYNLPSISLPEIVRFRVCADGAEIGSNIETLVSNVSGNVTVTATIPPTAVNSVLLKAEVTIDELNSACGDPGVVTKTSDTSIPISGTALPVATHYIEYDLAFLPAWFLDLIVENIQYMSDTIGPYLPFPGDVEYVRSEYVSTDAKFRIYVKYTGISSSSIYMPGLGLPNDLLDPNNTYYYNSSTGRVETVVIPTALSMTAGLIAGVLIFRLLANIVKVNPYGIAAAAVVSIIAATLISFAIVELFTGDTTNGEAVPLTPKQKIEEIKEFTNTYVQAACEQLYQDCVTVPPICDTDTMRAYIGCIAGEKFAQCMHAAAAAGDPVDSCENIRTQIMDIDTCLANGLCTVQEAKNMLDGVIETVDTAVEQKLAQVTCPTDQTYNPDTRSCVPNAQCTIRNPFGGCILSQEAAGGIMMVGAALIGAYLVVKMSPRGKSSGGPTPA